MKKIGYQILHLFVFGNFYMALCAVLMVWETQQIFELSSLPDFFYAFIFFATLSSYNLHWYLSVPPQRFPTNSIRLEWSFSHHNFIFILFIISTLITILIYWFLRQYFFYLTTIAFFTFLYTAPKILIFPFTLLRKIAIGKTLYLTTVWTFVSTFLPILLSSKTWENTILNFGLYRFFLIYAICILFDWRDRPHDIQAGIKSLITYLNVQGIKILYFSSLGLCLINLCIMYLAGNQLINILYLSFSVLILLFSYTYFSKYFSDYVYYLFLDGMLILSAILRLIFIG